MIIISIMKILSIDVGIKNLAFCLFDVFNDKCEIVKWDVLNLCTIEKEKCDECENNALYEKHDNKYCTKHAKKHSEFIIPKYSETQLKKKRHNELTEYYNSINKNDDYDVKKKKTKNELLELIQLYYNECCLYPIQKIKANEIDLIQVGIIMKKKFDHEFKQITIDKILIENQISPLANRMKTVQGMITQYFIMKNIYEIYYISSINKLKYYVDHKTTYDERKKLSIDITKILVKKHFNKIDFENNNKKKKDDLADCMLQGLYYMIHHKLICEKYCKI
jgi:hypothetical protein